MHIAEKEPNSIEEQLPDALPSPLLSPRTRNMERD